MKYQKKPHRLKIRPQNPLMNLPYSTNGLQVLKPLYLNVGPKSQLLKPIIQEEITPMTDIAPTNTNTDTPPQITPMKRSHHKQKPTNTQNPVTSGIEKLDNKASGTQGPQQRNRAPRVNTVKLKAVTDGVTSLYATIGIFAYARDQYDGLIIMTTAQDRAVELVNVAKHHKWLMDLLIRLTQSSDYVTLAIGHAGLVYAIMAHHNQIPKNEALLAQFGYTEQQVATKAAMMQAAQTPQGPTMEQAATSDVEAQYAAMQQQGPQPVNFADTLYETGNDYDTTNPATADNTPPVSRFNESVLETR